MMEYKSVPAAVKSIDGRKVTGIFAVHGNIDSYEDVSHPGSLAKTIAERKGRIKFLWNHDFYGGPPIAKILDLREITREELPDRVLALAPDATGGVEVVREYLKNERANAVYEAVAEGASDEMSYAYDPVLMDFSERDGHNVRNLREMRLYEVSDVIFGANNATVGSKNLPLAQLAVILDQRVKELKAGARHSNKDAELINQIAHAAIQLGATNIKFLDEVIDDVLPKQNSEADDATKSRAALEVQTALTLQKARLFFMEMGVN